MSDRTIEFVRPWRTYEQGDRITPSGTLREILLSGRNPYCKAVDAQPIVEDVQEVKPRGRKGKAQHVASESL